MPLLLEPTETDATEALDVALAEMERRSNLRRALSTHIENCPECLEAVGALCRQGAELTRMALG